MAIQAQLSYNAPFIGTGGSELSLINNDGGIGINQSYMNNQQALFHTQQNRSQSFFDAHMEKQRREIDQFIRVQVRNLIISSKDLIFTT